MKKGIVLAVVALLAVVGAVFVLSEKTDDASNLNIDDTSSSQTPAAEDNTSEQSPASTENAQEATITYTNDGFSPASLTVKSGTVVTVKNESSRPLQFSSDPHPEHTNNSELNESVTSPGKSTTFTAKRTGTYGYHNHLDETHTGSLVVE